MSDTTTEPTTQVTTGADAQPVESVESTAVESKTEAPTGDTVEQPEKAQQEMSDDTLDWAKKKGLPLSEKPTEAELKLVKMQRDAERRMHEATNAESKLKETINDQVANADFGTDVNAQLMQEVAALKVNQQLSEFYAVNPDARQYDADMAALVTENPALAQSGLESLYALAKHRKAVNEADTIKKEGAKEALENVALKQQAAALSGQATTHESPSSGVTIDELRSRIKAGDKDWIRKNQAAIDRLGQ